VDACLTVTLLDALLLAPRPDPRLRPGIETPTYVTSYGRPRE
jgi:hypothetical protein